MKQLWLILLSCFLWTAFYTQAVAQTSNNPIKSQAGINDPKAHEYLKQTRSWFQSCKSLKIQFTYRINSIDKKSNFSNGNGNILIAGKMYRLQIKDQIIYCNGINLWIYNPTDEEVSINNYNPSDESLNPLSVITRYEKFYRAKYIRQETIAGKPRIIIDLLPLKASNFHKIRVYLTLADHRLYQMDMYTKNEQIYVYTLLNYQTNPPFSSADFLFNTAKHPQVMINDMR
ncbi:MAG: outer membrane lipoprotein carrier protein LolA [Bacteroidales bacterium]